MFSLQLLGQPQLQRQGVPVRLTVKKTWVLLVLLGCRGETPRARLAAWLWPGLDESTARRNLRRELARLREAQAGDLLRASDDWLALQASAQSDVALFEVAVQGGHFLQALALWRGPLADGLATDDMPEVDHWLTGERSRMHGLWRHALQSQAQALSTLEPDRALAHWHRLLADDPLQEQHHQAVMRLYLAQGRREEVLAQHRRCVQLLREELGLTPSADTDALAKQALAAASAEKGAPNGAVADLQATASPRMQDIRTHEQMLPDTLPFVGRDAEVSAMEAAWHAKQVIVIEGEGGVGKTRLAQDFAAAHGPYAVARCRSGDASVPYAAWTRVLRALAGTALDRAAFAALPPWACDELARLLPELAATTEAAPIRSDEERSRFFTACAAGWQALAADSFDAVLLDDWHFADAASGAVMAFVLQQAPDTAGAARAGTAGAGAALMPRVVVLLRPTAESAAPAPGAVVPPPWPRGLAAHDDGRLLHLRLAPLPAEAVSELLQQLSGAASPRRFAARLQQVTEGNPFFLAQTLRHLVETGALTAAADGRWQTPFDDVTHDYRELTVPASVRDAVLVRVSRLGPAAERVLEAAALASEPFAPALLAPACAMSELEAVLAIEQAVQARLLREHEAGGYAFAHDLVQQALDGALAADRRRLVHRRLALGAEAAGSAPEAVARHHELSGEPRRAVAHRLAAAERAQRLHALPEAMAQWQRALDDGATPAQALRAHQGLTSSARLACEFERMRAHTDALQALADGGALSTSEQAEALIAVADSCVFDKRTSEALAVLARLDATTSAALPAALQARAAATRGNALCNLGQLGQARDTLAAALALPGLPAAARSDLLDGLTAVELSAGEPVALRRHADAALALARQQGNEETAARALFRGSLAWLMEGDTGRAAAGLEQAAASFASRGSVYRQRHVLYNLCVAHQASSHHAKALAAAERGWALLPPIPEGEMWMMFRLAFVDAQLALGELGEAWRHAEPTLAYAQSLGAASPVVAALLPSLELLGLIGEAALARRLLAQVGAEAVSELRYTATEHWVSVAQFELSQAQPAAAQEALARVVPAADIADVRVRARHALAMAELALAQGDGCDAVQALLPAHDAPGMNDEMRTRALALKVRAQGLRGALQPGTTHAARAALAAPSPFAPATLELHRALRWELVRGTGGVAPTAADEHAAFVGRLAQSLSGHPAHQAAFLQITA